MSSCLKDNQRTIQIISASTVPTEKQSLSSDPLVVQSRSHVQLFATPWTATRQASLSFTISGRCSNSCLLSQWCHPTTSTSVFSSCPQSFPASGSLPMSWLFTAGSQNIGISASAAVLTIWFPLGLTGLISLSSPAPQLESVNCLALSLPYGPTLTSEHDHWEITIALTVTDICCQSDLCLLIHEVCHSFSSKVRASFNFMAAVTVCSDSGAWENKTCQFPLFPHLFAMKWWDWMPWS